MRCSAGLAVGRLWVGVTHAGRDCLQGANLMAQDRWGHTPLDEALRERHENVAALLQGRAATLSARAAPDEAA